MNKNFNFSTSFRNSQLVKGVVEEIKRITTKPWTIMEICGGQTHAIMQYGIDQILPKELELVHGPGCPVCVTPLDQIDRAHAIAAQTNVIFCTFGDMLRVPGSSTDLFSLKAQGAQIKVVYSPIDAVKIAQENPGKQIVFFAIGFETTIPANASSIIQAKAFGLRNFSILVSQVCVPPAMEAILSSPSNRVQAFLAAGHVCAVMGYWQYHPISQKYQVPIVVTGFEPLDLLQGILKAIRQLECGTHIVENAYQRAVSEKGNQAAQEIINRVFEPCDRNWRGIGTIPFSGMGLRSEFDEFNAEHRFNVEHIKTQESEICIAGQILQGLKKPYQCPAFCNVCVPTNPLGAPMVSSEGACSAYYRFSLNREEN
ncbi:MAG: hydrogenase formation protein HypD [Anaerolineaceae bacterium]|nr:hydrogenase formation protein HypD [Anaerolineaceae bacterium]